MAKTKTPEQRKKRAMKRAIKKATNAAAKAAVVTELVAGKGSYKTTRAKLPRITGRGGYFTDLLKNVGGKALKGLVSGAANSFIPGAGEFAGDIFTNITGLGNYKLNRNSLAPAHQMQLESSPNIARPPSFATDGTGSDLIFTHAEYVADVISSTAFSSTTYLINPGNPLLFPWLSQLAALYELYEMDGLVFEFRPTSATSVATSNPGMGVVMMATEYDVYDAGFGNKREMDSAEYASSGLPYERFVHPVECDPRRGVTRSNYVLPGVTVVAGVSGDARLDFLGAFTIATQGQQTGGAAIGELWVSYKIRLSRPILESNLLTVPFTQHVSGTASASNSAAPVIVTNNTSGGAPFNVASVGTGANANFQITNTNGYTGIYLITYVGTATGSPAYSNTSVTPIVTGATFVTTSDGGQFHGAQNGYSGLFGGLQSFSTIVNFTTAGTATVEFGAFVVSTTGAWDIIINPYNQYVNAERTLQKARLEDPIAIRLSKMEKALAMLAPKEVILVNEPDIEDCHLVKCGSCSSTCPIPKLTRS